MQCILTVAVAAVVTASHRDLQAKPHCWLCFPFSFTLVLPLSLQHYFFFSDVEEAITRDKYRFTNIILSIICIWLRWGNAISQQRISWLTGDFPPTPWSTACLLPPLCFVPSWFPCPHRAMALLELAATLSPSWEAPARAAHSPLPWQCPMGIYLTLAELWPGCPCQAGSMDMRSVERGSALVTSKQEAHPRGK